MSDMIEGFRALKEYHQEQGEERRQASSAEFEQALEEAGEAGLTLLRYSDEHYQITSPSGWLINFYPGNGRIYRDTSRRVNAPVLNVPSREGDDRPGLLGVVRAAVANVEAVKGAPR